jgi:hypothetical protein
MSKIIPSLLLVSVFFLGSYSHAAVSPLAVGIVNPIQFPPDDFGVTGARFSVLWGQHRDLYGVDFGVLGNITDQTFSGIGLSGLFNITHGTTTAIFLQGAGLTNINTGKTYIYGVQLALGVNYNSAESAVSGLQLSLANLSDHTKIYGVQAGIYNKAQDVYGLQIGLVNIAQSLHGIQIGLLNYNATGTFVVAPILNVGF